MTLYLGYHCLTVFGFQFVYTLIFGHPIETEFEIWFPNMLQATPVGIKYVLFYWFDTVVYNMIELLASLMIFYYIYHIDILTIIKLKFLNVLMMESVTTNLRQK